MLLTKHDFIKRRTDTYGHTRTSFVLQFQRLLIRASLKPLASGRSSSIWRSSCVSSRSAKTSKCEKEIPIVDRLLWELHFDWRLNTWTEVNCQKSSVVFYLNSLTYSIVWDDQYPLAMRGFSFQAITIGLLPQTSKWQYGGGSMTIRSESLTRAAIL